MARPPYRSRQHRGRPRGCPDGTGRAPTARRPGASRICRCSRDIHRCPGSALPFRRRAFRRTRRWGGRSQSGRRRECSRNRSRGSRERHRARRSGGPPPIPRAAATACLKASTSEMTWSAYVTSIAAPSARPTADSDSRRAASVSARGRAAHRGFQDDVAELDAKLSGLTNDEEPVVLVAYHSRGPGRPPSRRYGAAIPGTGSARRSAA